MLVAQWKRVTSAQCGYEFQKSQKVRDQRAADRFDGSVLWSLQLIIMYICNSKFLFLDLSVGLEQTTSALQTLEHQHQCVCMERML